MMSSNEISKPGAALKLLEIGTAYIHLNPRYDGVRVPSKFTDQDHLVLQIGYPEFLAVPINDLHITDAGFNATLSFDRTPFCCWVPWAAVFAISGDDKRGIVWPDAVPPSIQMPVVKDERPRKQSGIRKKSHLRVIK